MSQTQLAMPLCPMCHMAMRLMLVKETGGRKLRCWIAASPMQSAETRAWLKGELGTVK
jgi:hypothetical protein